MIKTKVLVLLAAAGILGGCNQSLSDGQTGAVQFRGSVHDLLQLLHARCTPARPEAD